MNHIEISSHKQSFFARLTILVQFLVMLMLFFSCAKNNTKNTTNTEVSQTVFAVSTTNAVRGELKDYLEFGGDVSAKTNIEVMPDAIGRIEQLLVSVGSYVSKDQVIAIVDPSRPGMTYAQSPVKAPISGTVTAVNVVVGNMVSQQMSIARISKTEELQISMHVPERFVSKIKMNQHAFIKFDAYPSEVFEAITTEISPVLDQNSRSMGVKLAFSSPDPRIKAGMFARVKLITDTRTNSVIIPESAIVTRFGEQFVFVINEKDNSLSPDDNNLPTSHKTKVRKQVIKPGIRVDDKIEILAGLLDGDEVVIRGQTLLEDGVNVNIVSRIDSLPGTEDIE